MRGGTGRNGALRYPRRRAAARGRTRDGAGEFAGPVPFVKSRARCYFVCTSRSRRADAVVAVLLTVTVAVPAAGTASLKCVDPPDRIVPE